jgi:transposase-like protein
MNRGRKHYSREYKLQAIQQAKESGLPISETARALGIRPALLYRWQEKARQETIVKDSRQTAPPPETVRQMQRKIQGLEEECAILKKALAIFSKPGR